MTTSAMICLLVFVVVIIMFAINKLPMAVVAMSGMLLMVVTGCLETKTAMSAFSSSTVLLLAPIFIISAAFSKTEFIGNVASGISRLSKGSYKKIVIGYVLMGLVVTQLMGTNTPAFMAIYPLLMATCREAKISPSKVLMPVAVTVVCATGAVPATTAITYSATYRGYLEAYGFADFANFTALDFCVARLPIVIVTVLWAIFYAPKHMPDTAPIPEEPANTSNSGKKSTLSPFQEKLTIAVFFLMIIGVILAKSIGIANYIICMILAVILVAAGVLRGKELFGSMGLSVILLYVGAVGIGTAVQESGAAEVLGNWMVKIMGTHPNQYVFGFCFFLLAMLVSQVLTNSACGYIFVPISLIACQAIGANPLAPMFLTLFGAMTSFITPMANPVAPIMFETGHYEIKDTLRVAPLYIIPVAIATTFWILHLYPLYG